jgi:hypothetical protein
MDYVDGVVDEVFAIMDTILVRWVYSNWGVFLGLL